MPLSPRFTAALGLAAELHAAQDRKSTGIPYVSHLLAVAGIVLENGGTEDEAIAALFHDIIEDSSPKWGGSEHLFGYLRDRFGATAADIVFACTDHHAESGMAWRERKERYLDQLRHSTPSVGLVAGADKLHNARSILFDYRELGDALWTRFNAQKQQQLWYQRALVGALQDAGCPMRLLDEFRRAVTEIEMLASAGEGSHAAREQ